MPDKYKALIKHKFYIYTSNALDHHRSDPDRSMQRGISLVTLPRTLTRMHACSAFTRISAIASSLKNHVIRYAQRAFLLRLNCKKNQIHRRYALLLFRAIVNILVSICCSVTLRPRNNSFYLVCLGALCVFPFRTQRCRLVRYRFIHDKRSLSIVIYVAKCVFRLWSLTNKTLSLS